MSLPPAPGPGPYTLALNVPAFYVLTALLAVLGVMLYLIAARPRGYRRGLQGYLEAVGIDLVFLVFSFLLVVSLALRYPDGNRTAYALYEVVVGGVWLTFAIPVVTVGSSVHHRSRGGIAWLVPSLVVAVALFGIFFAVYYLG